MLNFIYVTFTHGLALPLLFPIALFGMINQFCLERVLLAKYYRQPPLFDGRLNKQALNAMGFAPIVMMMFGYWYLGNRQMFFFDEAKIRINESDSIDPGHYLFQFYSKRG